MDKAIRLSANKEYNLVAFEADGQTVQPVCLHPIQMPSTPETRPASMPPLMPVTEVSINSETWLTSYHPWLAFVAGMGIGSLLHHYIHRRKGCNIGSRGVIPLIHHAANDVELADAEFKQKTCFHSPHRCRQNPQHIHSCPKSQHCPCANRRRRDQVSNNRSDSRPRDFIAGGSAQHSAVVVPDGNGCIDVYPGCYAS